MSKHPMMSSSPNCYIAKGRQIISERTKGGHRRYDLESVLTYANCYKSCEKVTANILHTRK